MFDYIFRAQALGWAVLVANPNVNELQGIPIAGSECPQQHLCSLWRTYVETANASCVLVVAHSYGGPNVVNLLKAEPKARERIQALAMTDGVAFPPGTLLQEKVPSEDQVRQSGKPEQEAALRRTLQHFATLAPSAFQPAGPEVVSCLASIGRNFQACEAPPGTPLAANCEGVTAVSSGHTSHPATTHAATKAVFAFLQHGAFGKASAQNSDLRAALA